MSDEYPHYCEWKMHENVLHKGFDGFYSRGSEASPWLWIAVKLPGRAVLRDADNVELRPNFYIGIWPKVEIFRALTEYLDLGDAKNPTFTDAGVAKLKAALPGCKIRH